MITCAAMLMDFRTDSSLALAWQHTGWFWSQTMAAIARHPVALLACAAVPAAVRAYVLLRGRTAGPRQVALLEGLVTVWRVFLCGVAVWAACSGREWRDLRMKVGGMAAWQIALGRLGEQLAHHLRMAVWEAVFFLGAMMVLHQLVRRLVRLIARWSLWLREPRNGRAMMSIVRNLVLVPIALIYLVEMARPALR